MLRREFFKRCSLAGLGFAAPLGWETLARGGEPARETQGYAGPYYVVFNASGGWDTTYLMDPKGVGGVNLPCEVELGDDGAPAPIAVAQAGDLGAM